MVTVIMWLLFALVILALFFVVGLTIALILVKRNLQGLSEELFIGFGKAGHSFIAWLIAPIFKLDFFLLWLLGKYDVRQQEPIPWEERPEFVGNHCFPGLQDVYNDIAEIFLRRPQNIMNPIYHFAPIPAEEDNFANQWYGFGTKICSIKFSRRSVASRAIAMRKSIRHADYGGSIISYPEGGRTQNGTEFYKSESEHVLRKFEEGAAYLSLKRKKPIVVFWKRIIGDKSKADKVSFRLLLKGFLRLHFDPRVKIIFDYGVVLYPNPNYSVNFKNKIERKAAIETHNQKIKEALFATADRQLETLDKRGWNILKRFWNWIPSLQIS